MCKPSAVELYPPAPAAVSEHSYHQESQRRTCTFEMLEAWSVKRIINTSRNFNPQQATTRAKRNLSPILGKSCLSLSGRLATCAGAKLERASGFHESWVGAYHRHQEILSTGVQNSSVGTSQTPNATSDLTTCTVPQPRPLMLREACTAAAEVDPCKGTDCLGLLGREVEAPLRILEELRSLRGRTVFDVSCSRTEASCMYGLWLQDWGLGKCDGCSQKIPKGKGFQIWVGMRVAIEACLPD